MNTLLKLGLTSISLTFTMFLPNLNETLAATIYSANIDFEGGGRATGQFSFSELGYKNISILIEDTGIPDYDGQIFSTLSPDLPSDENQLSIVSIDENDGNDIIRLFFEQSLSTNPEFAEPIGLSTSSFIANCDPNTMCLVITPPEIPVIDAGHAGFPIEPVKTPESTAVLALLMFGGVGLLKPRKNFN
ncbi:hypothetical protein [Okeania sp. SIO2B3]|uniref:hypothetical protein n=1 Tax=Okeania sp. SIO2B3 TaxID=2607784 RepID=UPI0013BFD243|nr:hypothetical protein [Okeania sp. SIO2B3]NET44772.1 hypothetical protein [Okeania sp. SIO2B3]